MEDRAQALRTEEPEAKFPGAWHLAKVIEILEAWEGMDQERLL